MLPQQDTIKKHFHNIILIDKLNAFKPIFLLQALEYNLLFQETAILPHAMEGHWKF